jgi:hypothetical protein
MYDTLFDKRVFYGLLLLWVFALNYLVERSKFRKLISIQALENLYDHMDSNTT